MVLLSTLMVSVEHTSGAIENTIGMRSGYKMSVAGWAVVDATYVEKPICGDKV